MPVYEYICRSCGHEENTVSSIAERRNQPCPKCGVRLDIKPSAPRVLRHNTNVSFEDFDVESTEKSIWKGSSNDE